VNAIERVRHNIPTVLVSTALGAGAALLFRRKAHVFTYSLVGAGIGLGLTALGFGLKVASDSVAGQFITGQTMTERTLGRAAFGARMGGLGSIGGMRRGGMR